MPDELRLSTEPPEDATKDEQPPARLPEAELRQLALDVANRKVFTDRHGEDAVDAFLCIRLMAMSGKKPKHLDQWGMLYEYLTEAGSRTINGRPTFFSCKILHVDDLEPFFRFYKQALEANKAFLQGQVPG